jgi:SNF2 family DNA or RNA helicase
MKRRMKIDHLSGLPQKESLPSREFMPPLQADRYADAVRQARASDERGKMLGALHDFRRISLAPLSWLDAGADDEAWSRSSARLISLFRILDEAHAAGEKVLVFLEEKSVQADLRNVLQRRYDLAGLPMVINGDVTGPSRQRQVGVFQEEDGFDVMLLSPKAGGVGLTLTAANHVVHLSRWWNPAVEDQCSDRVYRIGQRRDVTIHHPLAIHPTFQDQSFDLLLDALLERKRSLSRHVLSPAAILQEQDGEDLFRRATQQTV